MRRPAIVALMLMFMLGLHRASFGQGGDRRISTAPTKVYTLSSNSKVQHAVRLGDRTLAVWGGSGYATDSSIVPVLDMQILYGNTPGVLRSPHGPDARPCGNPIVLGLRDEFFVVWTDCRAGAPGMYGRRVGFDGEPIGQELFLGKGTMVKWRCWGFTTSGSGEVLIWEDGRGGYHAMGFGASVETIPADVYLGARVPQILSSPHDSSLFMIRADSGAFIARYGGLQRTTPPRDLRRLLVWSDGGIVQLDSGALDVYDAITDSMPRRIVPIPGLDSATPGTATIAVDSAGGYRIYFSTVHITGSRDSSGTLGIRVYRVDVDSALHASSPRRVDSLFQDNGAWHRQDPTIFALNTFDGSSASNGSDNTSHVDIWLKRSVYATQQWQSDSAWRFSYSVGKQGEYARDGSRYYSRLDFPSPYPIINRLAGDSLSKVVVSTGSDSVVLSAPLASAMDLVPCGRPTVMLSGGQLLVTWTIANSLVCGALTGSLQILPDTAVPRVLLGTYQRGSQSFCEEHLIDGTSSYSNDISVDVGAFPPHYLITESRYDRVTRRCTYQTQVVSVFSGRQSLALPTTAGFFEVARLMAIGSESPIWFSGVTAFPIDGVTGLIPVLDESGRSGPGTVLILFDPATRKSTNILRPVAVASTCALFQIGPQEYVTAYDTLLRHVSAGALIETYTIPRAPSKSTYQNLSGSRFIRYYSTDTARNEYALELFDYHGRIIARRSLTLPGLSERFTILDHAASSRLLLLYGSATGVHAVGLDSLLRTYLRDTTISDTRDSVGRASGVLVGDSLVAVWEDHRDGGPTLYAAGWRIPSGSTPVAGVLDDERRIPDDASGGALAIEQVVPLPARDRATVIIRLRDASAVTIELVDMLGRSVLDNTTDRLPAGEHGLDLDLGRLVPGIYFVKLSADGHEAIGRLTVAR